jgi:hypothetical protein
MELDTSETLKFGFVLTQLEAIVARQVKAKSDAERER